MLNFKFILLLDSILSILKAMQFLFWNSVEKETCWQNAWSWAQHRLRTQKRRSRKCLGCIHHFDSVLIQLWEPHRNSNHPHHYKHFRSATEIRNVACTYCSWQRDHTFIQLSPFHSSTVAIYVKPVCTLQFFLSFYNVIVIIWCDPKFEWWLRMFSSALQWL